MSGASFFRVDDLEAQTALDGVKLRSITSPALTLSFVDYEAGAAVASHSHDREQITCVLDGFLEVTIDGAKRVLGPGEGVRIPPGTTHASRPVGGAVRAIDAWTPLRP